MKNFFSFIFASLIGSLNVTFSALKGQYRDLKGSMVKSNDEDLETLLSTREDNAKFQNAVTVATKNPGIKIDVNLAGKDVKIWV